MRRVAWPIVIATSATNKRAQDQLSHTVNNPTPPIKAVLQPHSKDKICAIGHTDKVGPETINKEVAQHRADGARRLRDFQSPSRGRVRLL